MNTNALKFSFVSLNALTIALVIAVSVLLGGCESSVGESTETKARSKIEISDKQFISVHYVTLRNRTGNKDPEKFYGDERNTVHTGTCEVSWNPIKALDSIAKNSPLYIPSESLKIEAIDEVDTQTFWHTFSADRQGGKPVLYIHGYNIGFEKGCKRAARFAQNLNLGSRLVLFSWPSDGEALNYVRDEADVAWSIRYLKETLTRMEVLFGAGGFDVVGHSLGGRGAALALATLSGMSFSNQTVVDKLVLVAPDIDAAIFEQQLPALLPKARQVTVYASEKDSALALSRELHGYPRLGEAGPHIVGLQGVEVIDVSNLDRRRVSGHLYHLYNEPVIRDLDELLNARHPASVRALPALVDRTVPNYWRIKVAEAAATE